MYTSSSNPVNATACGVLQFKGVNVSSVGLTVTTSAPRLSTLTVTSPVGSLFSHTVCWRVRPSPTTIELVRTRRPFSSLSATQTRGNAARETPS